MCRNIKKHTFRHVRPGEDSDQPAHSRRLIRIFTEGSLEIRMQFHHADNEDSDQAARMHKLI